MFKSASSKLPRRLGQKDFYLLGRRSFGCWSLNIFRTFLYRGDALSEESAFSLHKHVDSRVALRVRHLSSGLFIPKYEFGKDYDAQPSKFARSYSHPSLCESSENKISVWSELPRGGMRNKEFQGKHFTQSFIWERHLQSLDVGLYRDKLRKHTRCLSTTVSSSDSESSMSDSDDFECTDMDSDDDREPLISPEVTAMESTLRDLEASTNVTESAIGSACLRLAQAYDTHRDDPLKILINGERALKILNPPELSVDRALCFQVIGCALFKLNDSLKAVNYLEQAASILQKVGVAKSVEGTIASRVQVYLGLALMSLGRKDEALNHYREAIATSERTQDAGSLDLGECYLQAAEAYTVVENFKEALALCMKAFPIFVKHYGTSSYEVASLRRIIAETLTDLGEYNKALSEYDKAKPIFLSLGKFKEVSSIDLKSGEIFLLLEKYKEAVAKLKGIGNTEESGYYYGNALLLLAKAYIALKDRDTALSYCNKAFDTLKKKKGSLDIASSLKALGSVYEQLSQWEQAAVVLQRALKISEQFSDEEEISADIKDQLRSLQEKCRGSSS